MEQDHQHLRFVDGVRAVAIVAVVLFHIRGHSPQLASSLAWLPVSLGLHGVELFFIVSGFCLSFPYLAALSASNQLRFNWHRFTAKRLVRILPPYWAALAIFVILSATPLWRDVANQSLLTWGAGVSETAREALLLDHGHFHNWSFWSLCVELRWYLVFPLALVLFVRSQRAIVVVGLVSWLLYYRSQLHAFDTLLLPAFLMGILAAHLLLARPRWLIWAPHVFLLLTDVALLTHSQWYSRGPLWQLIAFFGFLTAGTSFWIRRICEWAPVATIGAASYSIYLIHEPFVAWLDVHGFPPIVAFAVPVAVGFAFWATVERPTMRPRLRARLVDAVEAVLLRAGTIRPGELVAKSRESSPAAQAQGLT
jgi:peptidoglycan/LPS O-acetylase OafA/YrhL